MVLLIGLPVHYQLDLSLRVEEQGEDGGGAGVDVEEFLHGLRGGEAQPGTAQLVAQVLGVEGLVAGHGQEVKLGFLTVAEHQIFAHVHAQHGADGLAVLHGVGPVVLHPLKGDVQLRQGVKDDLLGLIQSLGGGLGIDGGDGHGVFSLFRWIALGYRRLTRASPAV